MLIACVSSWRRKLGTLEQLGDGHARVLLDRPVEIDEVAPDPLGQLRAQGRLAGPHEADQRDVAIGYLGVHPIRST